MRDVNIQQIFPPIVYQRGLKYYKQNRIIDLVYDINYHVWTALVHGSEHYFVEINTSYLSQGSIDAYCDCPAYDTKGPCKHIAAVLIAIKNREQTAGGKSLTRPNYEQADEFIRAMTSIQPHHSSSILPKKIPLYVEYHCHVTSDEYLWLDLKAGVKRSYVVKDLFQFLENIFLNQEHFFTKKFSYIPERHYILSQDMEILEILYDVLRNEQIYKRNRHPSFRSNLDEKRYLLIPPLIARRLLQKLAERKFMSGAGLGENEQQISIEMDVMPLQYSLSKNEYDDLLLTHHNLSQMMYISPYRVLYSDGTFYFPKKEHIPIVEQVMQFGLIGNIFPIRKSQADVFISEVLPSLEKVGDVSISEHIQEEIIQVPLRAKFYLQWNEGTIVGTLQYHYGHEVIDPFSERKSSDVIIIRDVAKEQEIMRLIEHANFHYNGKELYIQFENDDELFNFFYTVLPLLDECVELFLTEDLQSMIVDDKFVPQTNVRMNSTTNLLEVGFDIEGIDDEEVQHILHAVIEKRRYYRLKSGALLPLEGEEISSIHQLMIDLEINKDDFDNGTVYMPAYRGLQVDDLIETKKNYDASFQKLLHHLQSPEEQTYALPESLHADLRNYQVTGYQWFKSLSEYHLGGILADDMGLGKTLQSIAYITSERRDRAHLIVVPSSVVYNWKNEFSKFAPSLTVATLTGLASERHKKIRHAMQTNIDVWITSYATLRQDIEYYRDISFQTLILDEAQYIKNYTTKTSQVVRSIQASRRFALSGTPIENSIDELWSIFQVILPGLMPNLKAFRKLDRDKIRMMTRPFILRRLKKDVLTELPEKIESVHGSELTNEQKELYLGYLRQLQQETAQSIKESGFHQNRMKILAGLTRLRQICCHPSLFIENYSGASGKLEQLMEIIHRARANGSRMLIFSQFTSMHKLIIEKLQQQEIPYFYLHGQINSQDRLDMSERFNHGEKDVFLISLKAGGTGLNLTGADTVILYDLWWNPAVEDQAAGRAHRFGQKNVVQVIRLIAEGTIEEKIYELQQKKRELIDQVIQPGETMLSSLSEEDVRQLLNI